MSHVLIIEDEPFVAMLIEDLLLEEGANSVEIVTSETAALEAAIAHPPDLITSDVRLAVGSGPSAIKAIKQRLGPIPVIFITGTPEECTGCEPPDRILSKPVSKHAVASAYHELADRAA